MVATEPSHDDSKVPPPQEHNVPYGGIHEDGKQTESQTLGIRKRHSYHMNMSTTPAKSASRVSRINFNIEYDRDEEKTNHADDDDAKSVDIDLDPKKPVTPSPVHQRKDFIWLIIGGSMLTFLAGTLNAISWLQTGYTATQASGSTTKLATNTYSGNGTSVGNYLLILGPFFMGATVSGLAVGSNKFVMGHRYGLILVVVGSLVLAGTVLMREGETMAGIAFWAWASGMQNAMYTSFSGAVVRTTHVTGTLTDIGNVIGHWIRSKFHSSTNADTWKLRVLVPLYLAFFAGGAAGAALSDGLGDDSGFIVGGMLLTLGVIYMSLGSCGLFDGFLEEEIIEKEMEVVEQQFHEALHKAYHSEQPSAHGVLSRQPSHHSVPHMQAHLHPVRSHTSASHHSHHSVVGHTERE